MYEYIRKVSPKTISKQNLNNKVFKKTKFGIKEAETVSFSQKQQNKINLAEKQVKALPKVSTQKIYVYKKKWRKCGQRDMNQPKGIGVIFQPKLRIKKNSPNSYTDEQAMKEGKIKCFKFFHFFQRSRGGSATERNDEKSWQVSLFFITFVNVLKIIKLQF